MDDLTLATLISLIFVGLLGMFIGYAVCLMRIGGQVKWQQKELKRLNRENLDSQPEGSNAG